MEIEREEDSDVISAYGEALRSKNITARPTWECRGLLSAAVIPP